MFVPRPLAASSPVLPRWAMPKLFLVLCACCWSSNGLAWNAEGHMVVAQIAYNHLDAAVKTKCDTLIAVPLIYASDGTSNFVTAAVWADDFKSQLGSGIWHYIDLPFSLDGTSTSGVATASFDVVQAINLSITTLQSSTAIASNRATSLRYLLHFVGDIQQPLHCSTAVWASAPTGDAGGNGFSISGTWNNLHSLWDAGGGYLTDSLSRPLKSAAQATLNAKVAAVEAAYPYTPNPGAIPNPMDWAQEGLGLAQTVAYAGITRNTTPSTSYTDTAQATTKARMAQGGHRLADLLNTLFAPKPVAVASFGLTNSQFGFSWNTVAGTTYTVQYKQQLSDPTWASLTNITASATSSAFTEPLNQEQRFYRVTE
jgi:hypothetical protein